jgi:hypothetical protein
MPSRLSSSTVAAICSKWIRVTIEWVCACSHCNLPVRAPAGQRSGDQPAAFRCVGSNRKKRACDSRNERGGNRTSSADDVNCVSEITCENCTYGLSGGCREDAALRELVAAWHGLTPDVREKIMELVRCSRP